MLHKPGSLVLLPRLNSGQPDQILVFKILLQSGFHLRGHQNFGLTTDCTIPLFYSHPLSTKIHQKKENRQADRQEDAKFNMARQCSSSHGTDQASGFCTSTCYFAKHEEQPSKTQNSNSFLFWNRITLLTLKTHRKCLSEHAPTSKLISVLKPHSI